MNRTRIIQEWKDDPNTFVADMTELLLSMSLLELTTMIHGFEWSDYEDIGSPLLKEFEKRKAA